MHINEKFACHGMPSIPLASAWVGFNEATLHDLIGNSYNLGCIYPIILAVMSVLPFDFRYDGSCS